MRNTTISSSSPAPRKPIHSTSPQRTPARPQHPRSSATGASTPSRHTPARRTGSTPMRRGSGAPSRTGQANLRQGSGMQAKRRTGGGARRRGNGRVPARKNVNISFSNPKIKEAVIPPVKKGDIRIIPLGGVEEVGKNMTIIETDKDIFIVDIGFQFRQEQTPGIDYILPNTKYLETRKDKIRAVLVTHGHLDHIGGIPFIMENIGNVPIYSRNLTTIMIRKRQEEFPHMKPLNIEIVEKDSRIAVGETHIRFFAVTHTIPDAMGVIIETPHGDIICTGDLKLTHVDGVPTEAEEQEFAKFKNTKNLLLMMDSTNVEQPGFSLAEEYIFENIKKIITGVKGRLIVGTFASLIERLAKIIQFSEDVGKKVVIDGRSMKNNLEIARLAGFFTPKKGTIIPIEEMENYPPDRIVIVATGAQGDEFASLMRASNNTHKHLKLNSRDTVLLSSSVVPGNEKKVQQLKDNIARCGPKIVHYRTNEVHSSGHANADETKWIHKKINPKFFIPVHGHHYMLKVHAELVKSLGMPMENVVVPDNGMIIEIQEGGTKIVTLPQKAASNVIMVDGFAIGDVQEVVIRDRQALAQDGMFVIVAIIDLKTGKVRKSPDIISRGFVYLRESQDLLRQARFMTKKAIESSTGNGRAINFDNIKARITDDVGRLLLQESAKRPMILPVLIGV